MYFQILPRTARGTRIYQLIHMCINDDIWMGIFPNESISDGIPRYQATYLGNCQEPGARAMVD